MLRVKTTERGKKLFALFFAANLILPQINQSINRRKKMKKILVTLSLVFAFSAVAAAQTNTPWVNKRQQNQKERIAKGLYSGKLTAKETGKLLKQQREIRQYERQAKSDGNVTFMERLRLHHKLNQANRNINRKKNN
jgi:hypothetical protein